MVSSVSHSVDVTLCEREPIHIPGTIQPHGSLVVTDSRLTVTHASQNVDEWLGATSDAIIGSPLSSVVHPKDHDKLRLLGDSCSSSQPQRAFLSHTNERTQLLCSAHRSADRLIFEFERFDEATLSDLFCSSILELHSFGTTISTLSSPDEILDITVKTVRNITGFDRVMAYRFDPDWHGVVIAEDRRPDMSAFLGLHFPASDIPAQARRLYQINPLRVIADRSYSPVPLVPLAGPSDPAPVDLTHAYLRSVSPLHLEYLRNLGVAASMSLSLLVDGKLWGLIACHHDTPLNPPPGMRDQCLLIAQTVALHLQSTSTSSASAEALRWRTRSGEIAARCSIYQNISEGLTASADLLQDWIPSGGFALTDNDSCLCFGDTPPIEAIRQIAQWLQVNHPRGVFATTSLANQFPSAEAWRTHAAGLLAIPIRGTVGNFLMLFRPEVLQTVAWAGNPSKSVVLVGDTAHLSPRRSFAIWSQIKHLSCLPWSDETIQEAQHLGGLLQSILQSHIESLASEMREITQQRARSDSFLRAAFKDSAELARGLRFAIERVRSSDGTVSSSESQKTVEICAERSLDLIDFLEDIGQSATEVFSVHGGTPAPVKDVITTAWNHFQNTPRARDIPTVLSVKRNCSDVPADQPTIIMQGIPCLKHLFQALHEAHEVSIDTIVLEYDGPYPTSRLSRLVPASVPLDSSFVLISVGGTDATPLSQILEWAAGSRHTGTLPNETAAISLSEEFSFRLARSNILTRALGGTMYSVQCEGRGITLLLVLPIAEDGAPSRADNPRSQAIATEQAP